MTLTLLAALALLTIPVAALISRNVCRVLAAFLIAHADGLDSYRDGYATTHAKAREQLGLEEAE